MKTFHLLSMKEKKKVVMDLKKIINSFSALEGSPMTIRTDKIFSRLNPMKLLIFGCFWTV